MNFRVVISVLIFIFFVKCVKGIVYNRRDPPNAYTIPVAIGNVVEASLIWGPNTVNVDLYLFQPGKVISTTTFDTKATCCTQPTTAILIANTNGNLVIWVKSQLRDGIIYTLTVKLNGIIHSVPNSSSYV